MLIKHWNMVTELIERESGLRPSEIDFIDDLYDDGEGNECNLSEKQENWLESIYERLVS